MQVCFNLSRAKYLRRSIKQRAIDHVLPILQIRTVWVQYILMQSILQVRSYHWTKITKYGLTPYYPRLPPGWGPCPLWTDPLLPPSAFYPWTIEWHIKQCPLHLQKFASPGPSQSIHDVDILIPSPINSLWIFSCFLLWLSLKIIILF